MQIYAYNERWQTLEELIIIVNRNWAHERSVLIVSKNKNDVSERLHITGKANSY